MRMMLLATAALMLTGCTPEPAAEPQSAPAPEAAAAASQHSAEYLAMQKAYADAGTPTITAITPTPGVARSLHVTGTAPAIWFIENQFPISLADSAGKVLITAPTRVVGDEPDFEKPVPWEVNLAYGEGETPAQLILIADQEGDFGDEGPPPPTELRVPLPLMAR